MELSERDEQAEQPKLTMKYCSNCGYEMIQYCCTKCGHVSATEPAIAREATLRSSDWMGALRDNLRAEMVAAGDDARKLEMVNSEDANYYQVQAQCLSRVVRAIERTMESAPIDAHQRPMGGEQTNGKDT